MAEPPSPWTVPGDEPEPAPQVPAPQMPAPQVPGPQVPGPEVRPQPGWGPPPGQANQWGAQPGQWGAQPGQWSGQPSQSGTQPGQWGGQPGQAGGRPGQWGGPPAPGNWVSRGPGIVPLRPLAIGEIYDGAIRAIRSNPRTMVGYSAIVISILTLLATAPQAYALSSLLSSPLFDPQAAQTAEVRDFADALSATGLTLLVGVLQFVLATTIVSGLLIVAVNSAVRGQSLNPAQLWARCRSRLLSVLGLACIVLLALPLTLLLAMLPGLIVFFLPSGQLAGGILMFLGALVGVFAYIVLYFGFWAVAAPALLLENLGIFASLRRSYRLVRGSFWRVFGIGLLTAVIAYIIRQLFSIPFALIGGLVSSLQGDGFVAILIQLLITDIGTVLAGAVLFPFTAGVAALLYLDLRMRREGLDVDLMRS